MASSTPSIRVLYIDNESQVREIVSKKLSTEFERLEVSTEACPADARKQIQQRHPEIDCIVCEYEFEDSTGVEFLMEVRTAHPELPFILFTNDGSEAVARKAISANITRYLKKSQQRAQLQSLGDDIINAVEQYQSATAAKQAKTQLDKLAATATDCLWIFDRDWDELHFISGYEEVWKRPVEAIEDDPRDFLNGIHPKDRPFVQRKMAEMSDGNAIDIEYRILKGDGETGWVWVKGEPTFDEAGNVVHVVGFTRDITERKQREQELQRTERRFEAMFNDPNILVGLLEPDGTVYDINQTALSYIDAELDDITGTPFWQTPWFTGDPEVQREVRECIQQAADGSYVEFELDLSQAVGTPLIVEGVFRPVMDDDGNVTSLLISDRDITDQRERERELELRDRAINEAPVGIVITDPNQDDNPITYMNNGFRNITQYGRGDVLGQNCRFLQGPLTEETSRAAFREAIDNREPIKQDILNYRKDGTPFWNNVQITPVFDESGELTNFIGFQSDITTRVEQERRTELLQKILRHNLRNELNVVLGNLSLIADDLGEETDAVRSARQSAISLLELSESAQRIEAQIKKASFTPKEIDLKSLLNKEITTVVRSYDGVTIETAIESDISVLAPDSVSIAIRELLENAVKHRTDETASVRIATETDRVVLPPEETEREVVIIHIEDENPPISELELMRLFGEEESPVKHGTGLGLWFVHWMVTMSGGLLSHEQREPAGNKISITLLRAQTDRNQDEN
jgi:PAS domain S-box-containing protein